MNRFYIDLLRIHLNTGDISASRMKVIPCKHFACFVLKAVKVKVRLRFLVPSAGIAEVAKC